MGLRSVRVGRLSGIPIGIQPLWLVIVALITVSLGTTYYPDQVSGLSPAAAYGLGLLSALLLFASILLHELGHAIVARRHGVEIEEIDLNLLPAFPLDGGRVARALIWRQTKDLLRATTLAASIGRGLGYGMIGLGVFAALAGGFGGLWLALIGAFVIAAAKAEADGLRVRIALGGREARNLVSFPAVCIPAEISVEDAVRDYFLPRCFSAFPVLEGGRLVGLIDHGAVERVPPSRRAVTTVGEVCIDEPSLIVDEPTELVDLIELPAFQRVGRAIVTTEDGRLGIVSITDVNQVLRALELAGEPTMRARSA